MNFEFFCTFNDGDLNMSSGTSLIATNGDLVLESSGGDIQTNLPTTLKSTTGDVSITRDISATRSSTAADALWLYARGALVCNSDITMAGGNSGVMNQIIRGFVSTPTFHVDTDISCQHGNV